MVPPSAIPPPHQSIPTLFSPIYLVFFFSSTPSTSLAEQNHPKIRSKNESFFWWSSQATTTSFHQIEPWFSTSPLQNHGRIEPNRYSIFFFIFLSIHNYACPQFYVLLLLLISVLRYSPLLFVDMISVFYLFPFLAIFVQWDLYIFYPMKNWMLKSTLKCVLLLANIIFIFF